MRNTRAIFLAAALLTGLPVAAYSQGKPAPADAFIYIIWPPDGATLSNVGRTVPWGGRKTGYAWGSSAANIRCIRSCRRKHPNEDGYRA